MSTDTQNPKEKPWSRWYAKNKDTFNTNRKGKYHSDVEYQTKAKEQARSYREKQAKNRPALPPEYTHNHAKAAETLGVSPAVLRGWRHRNLYPTPHEHEGKLYFTAPQVQSLKALVDFFKVHGFKVKEENKPKLNDLSTLIYANW